MHPKSVDSELYAASNCYLQLCSSSVYDATSHGYSQYAQIVIGLVCRWTSICRKVVHLVATSGLPLSTAGSVGADYVTVLWGSSTSLCINDFRVHAAHDSPDRVDESRYQYACKHRSVLVPYCIRSKSCEDWQTEQRNYQYHIVNEGQG